MPLTWAQVAQRAIQTKTDVAAQQTRLTLDLDEAFAGVTVWADEVEEEERRGEGRGGEEVKERDEGGEVEDVGSYGGFGFDGHVDDAMERVEREQALFEGAGKRVAVGIPVVMDEVASASVIKEDEGVENNGKQEQPLTNTDDPATEDATSAPTTPKKRKKRKSKSKSEDISPLKKEDQERKQEEKQEDDSTDVNTNTSYRFSSVAEHENAVTAPYWRDSEKKSDKGDDVEEDDKSKQQNPSDSATAYRFSTAAEHEQPVTAPFWRMNEKKTEKDVSADQSEEQGKEFTDEDDDGDEALSPRLKEYMDKHNEMMQHQIISSPHPHEILSAALRAQSIARDLLASEAAHHDLPLIMHAHACLVIGCSDSDDCYERMVEACGLFQAAVQEGVLEREKGREMLEVCRKVMGVMRKGEGEDESEGSEGSGDDKDIDDGEEDGGEDCGEDYRLP